MRRPLDAEFVALRHYLGLADGTTLREIGVRVPSRNAILNGQMRSAWLDATARALLSRPQGHYLVTKALDSDRIIPFPDWAAEELRGASTAILAHPHFARAQRYVARCHARHGARVCLMLPCHRRKPYSVAPTVRAVIGTLRGAGLLDSVWPLVLSIPGVVPLELDGCYPFAFYDWDPRDENAAVVQGYVEALAERLRSYLWATRRQFSRYVAYFRPRAAELAAVDRAAADLSLAVTVVPSAATVERLVRRSPVTWRFAGLKRPEYLNELLTVIEAAREREPTGKQSAD